MNGPSFENENEVFKIVEKAVASYELLDHLKNRIGGKYNTIKKSDGAAQTVINLNNGGKSTKHRSSTRKPGTRT